MDKMDEILDKLEEQKRYLEQIKDILIRVFTLDPSIFLSNWEELVLNLSDKIKEKSSEIGK